MQRPALNEHQMWQAVCENLADFDGRFYYAVQTTGVFCKPSCKSPLPKRENVRFFDSPTAAQGAGFRPCKRCQPLGDDNTPGLIARACEFISHSDEMPSLGAVAAHVGLSPSHLHRRFAEALGLSPRSYADATRQQRLRHALQSGGSVAEAVYAAGYGSSSRVYEFAYTLLGMTPKAYQQGGPAQHIAYDVVPCRLGYVLIASTQKGICAVQLGDDPAPLRHALFEEFHAAEIEENSEAVRLWTAALVAYIDGAAAWPMLPYDVQATAFQRKVWEKLRSIPPGQTLHYHELAAAIGQPQAARAVARACASNPVALVIPCHRIVPKAGGVGGYRWQPERKAALLDMEAHAE